MRDGLRRSTLKRGRSLEELSPVSSAASAGAGRVDDMEEAPLRKRRRTSSLCSEHSALEEAEQLTDEGQVHLGVPIREDVGGMRRDEEEASFESPLSQVTRPSFLAVLSSSEEATRPALDTVMEGDEIEVHAAQSSHSQVSESSPSVMSLGSETSEASTPVEGSESEEESAGIGEAVEALEGNSEQSSTRSTDEEVLMEEVEVHGGEEHSEEAEVMEDESGMQELDMDNVELLPAHESEIGKPDATHDEEYSDGEEEVKTPTADSLLEYKAVEDTNLIESSSESLQFSPDEEVESPLGSGPIEWDHSPTSSGGLQELDGHSSQRSQSEELEILGSEQDEDEANNEGSTAEEHYDHGGRVEERSGVLDDAEGDREAVDAMEPAPIPMSATGRPLRRAAIAALEEIHAEAASNTRPHHFHSSPDAVDFQDEHGQMAEVTVEVVAIITLYGNEPSVGWSGPNGVE
ncbi:erythrocyte membrane antigen Pc96, putative [Perkinsus marinus ATCC 50983]|uniref:Erythrocyte membrane antigen Pc96, putative n=1 Tax=Perkinsus marinus (strain ATCC 50983 / TXsc) TaxID=423536 RepID=C5KCG1_PERM5|nr:erythrocyte membrane antigen Pc96, putative [Perkinsus marinus ATCC 50983]EER17823.1 erythrocyte membrane antigen Pc96, putative [Perkinsus marinus ATCC 50983]|eukprot:XP_002786027.1 erythrocyte membrane antigen Pc96, putative [Perkinsus marinus ATCC 50983]